MKHRNCAFAAGAWLAAFLITTPAGACVTAADIARRVESELPGAGVTFVEGPIADRITAGISSVAGAVVPAGGSYVLAELPGAGLTYVVRIASGCATHHGRFPRQLVRIWMDGRAAENGLHD